jgi:RNA recognition motif-containing protein
MKDMSTQPIKIYVGNVPVVARNSELKELFEKFGKVVECDILKDFAFVHMDDTNDAKAAIAGLHDTLWKGARLRVELSTTRTNKGEPGERYSSRDRERDTDNYSSSSKHHQNGRSDRDRDRDHRDRIRRDGPPLPPSSYDSNRLSYDRKAGASYPNRFSDTRRDSYHPYPPESRYYQDDGPLGAHPYNRGGGGGGVRDSRYPMDANRYPYPVNDLAYGSGLPSRSRTSRDEMRLSSNDLGLELIRAANGSGAYSSREREPPYFDRRGGGGPPPPLSSTNGMRNGSGYDSFYRGPPIPLPPTYHQSYNGYPASSR